VIESIVGGGWDGKTGGEKRGMEGKSGGMVTGREAHKYTFE
jgi:hypothetical protein